MKHLSRFAPIACLAATGIGLASTSPAAAATVGFEFYLGNATTSNASGSNLVGTRFTADRDMTIDTLHVNLNNGSGTATLLLRADDGSGNPLGTNLASGTFTPAAGWNQVGVSSTSLVAGQVYHLLAQSPSGSAGTRVILNSKTDVHTHSGMLDPQAAQMYSSNSGGSWTEYSLSGRATTWGVSNSETGDALGQPYTSNIGRNLGATVYRGQTFTFDGADDSYVNSMTVNITRNSNTATAGDVRLHLIDAANPASLSILASGTIVEAGDLAAGERDFFTLAFTGEDRPILDAGGKYLIAAESTGSSASNTYSFLTSRTESAAGALFDLDYQGTASHTVIGVWGANGPTSLGTDDSTDFRYDSYFSLDVTAVPEPGALALMGLGVALAGYRRR